MSGGSEIGLKPGGRRFCAVEGEILELADGAPLIVRVDHPGGNNQTESGTDEQNDGDRAVREAHVNPGIDPPDVSVPANCRALNGLARGNRR